MIKVRTLHIVLTVVLVCSPGQARAQDAALEARVMTAVRARWRRRCPFPPATS